MFSKESEKSFTRQAQKAVPDSQVIELKSASEIDALRIAGRAAAQVLSTMGKAVRPLQEALRDQENR